jgi:hypothetical protein
MPLEVEVSPKRKNRTSLQKPRLAASIPHFFAA